MNPFAVTLADSEEKNQAALFRWLAMASAFGLRAANDPDSYKVTGHAKKVADPLPKMVSEHLSLVHASMNGLKLADARQGAAAKAVGLKPGIPDICVPVPVWPYHGLYVELKTPRGHLENSQKIVIPLLRGRGYLVNIAIGWKQASDQIVQYLQGNHQ